MTGTTKAKKKKAKRRPGLDEQQAPLSPSEGDAVSTAYEDPAVVAAREAADAAAAFSVIAATADENAPEFKAAQRQSEKADAAFADAPITSPAGALVKMREIAEMMMTGQLEDTSLDGRHFKTVVAFLEMGADAPVTSVAGALAKMREIVIFASENDDSTLLNTRYINTVVAFLEGRTVAAEPDPAVMALAEYREAKTAEEAFPDDVAVKEPLEYLAAGDRRYAAGDAVLDAVPTSLAGVGAKIRYVFDHQERGNDLWPAFDCMAKAMLPFLEESGADAPDTVVTLFAEWAIIRDEATAHGEAIDALNDDTPKGAGDELNTRLEAAWARTDALEDKIMATQATSMRGVAIKIRLASHYAFDIVDLAPLYDTPSRDIDYDAEHGAGGALNDYLVSALRDAERLAGS